MPVNPFFVNWSGPDLEMAYASPVIVLEKGARKSSYVRHMAKEAQPLRRFRDEDGKASSDGRTRRLFCSSDDDGSFTDEGFINHDFRVGGPNLCPLPAKTYEIKEDHPLYPVFEVLKRRMDGPIGRILDGFGIDDDYVEFVGRTETKFPDGCPKLTVLISAKRTVMDGVWLNAARAIRASLLSLRETEKNANAKKLLENMVVEILENTDDHTINREAQDNPATVLILAYPWSNTDWKGFRDDVVKVLDRACLPMVAVEISTACNGEEKEPRVEVGLDSLHGLNRLYQTIAPTLDDDVWGTLSGFIELLGLPDVPDGRWTPFGLTCYHCVKPNPEREGISYDKLTSRILQDKNYLAGEDRQKRRQLFRPMEVDEPQYNKQVEHLRDLRLLTLELEEKMKNPYSEFGNVFAASGFKLPDGKKATDIGSLDSRRPFAGRPVWAYGFRQGLTWGLTNGLQEPAFLMSRENGYTETIVIHRDVVLGLNGKPFANKGDSGTFVFTGDGILLGMMYGGRRGANSNVNYIMRTVDLLQDIKERTGAKDIRLRQ
ncbi:hypothetical protein PEX2_023620 [Penicillium expansum]|uniref:Peptidase S64, Ssy5 n=1 Tax=Penicillium expansum TaxID=27334 RepID=A0A0A2JEM4_PENEN|nr:hypothetical protein PEX2_023620 [Penicillium expansum]KGO53834.1 hypothetical protein PEX2_023620 [Penicillium expansum]